MMRQYKEAKESIPPDAVLLFRLGDFYEEFFEDAKIVSEALELVLTKRGGVPMCGFPHHALESYLPRLVAKGLKVAIAEQMEDPKQAQGIVKRQVTRIITPGTVVDNNMLDSAHNNYLCALAFDRKSVNAAVAAIDVSTGEYFYMTFDNAENLASEFSRLGPREILISKKEAERMQQENAFPDTGNKPIWTTLDDDDFDPGRCREYLCRHFDVATLDSFGFGSADEAVAVAAAVLRYAAENLRQDVSFISELEKKNPREYLELDSISLRNLEIVTPRFSDSRTSSLLGVIDQTSSSMGSRKLRSWILRPLLDHDKIVARLDAVDAFFSDPLTLAELQETLGVIRDLERIVCRINLCSATPRDYLSLAVSLDAMPGIKSLLGYFEIPLLEQANSRISCFDALVEKIQSALVDEPPALTGDGGFIRPGYCPELDELRNAASEGKSWLSSIQQREAERTGIKSLKVKFNSVFGYYIEVSKANLDLVPQDYIRKQTLVNAERFITPELKELESKILGAEERSKALENKLFAELREFALDYTSAIQQSADALSDVDALAGLARCARINRYRRPHIFDDDRLLIKGGRHPVVEQSMESGSFVPNDCTLDGGEFRLMMLTGPNMAGKSTYIRQTALLVILAQMGSFVPADYAEIGIVDRIFTRIGASDDLSRNQSTFMVEMVETANILRNATRRSLVILDEIGRGTSTFDGLSIAWSVAEYLHDDVACRTQFATHYHELTELACTRRGVKNYNVAVREYGDDIIFLRQIVPGAADRSYGIHVAKLAGVPREVLDRAQVILELLERTSGAPQEVVAALPLQNVIRKRRKKKSGEDDPAIQLKLNW